jgi:hypothetical protein
MTATLTAASVITGFAGALEPARAPRLLPIVTDPRQFCSFCYLSGIERQIRGFTLPVRDSKRTPSTVLAMDPGLAASLRIAANAQLDRYARLATETRRHPHHAGA